jgi:hypothetical protein
MERTANASAPKAKASNPTSSSDIFDDPVYAGVAPIASPCTNAGAGDAGIDDEATMAATVNVGAGEGAAVVGGETAEDEIVGAGAAGKAGLDVVVTDGIGVNTKAMGFVVEVTG